MGSWLLRRYAPTLSASALGCSSGQKTWKPVSTTLDLCVLQQFACVALRFSSHLLPPHFSVRLGTGHPFGLPRPAFTCQDRTRSEGCRADSCPALPGANNSPNSQTPGSRPACDTGRQHLSAKLLWKPSGDFTDSESDDFEEPGGRCFRVCWKKLPEEAGQVEAVRYLGAYLPHSGLFLSSLASSLAALTSSSSSAACSVQYSRPLPKLPPSSTWGSCQIQVRSLPPGSVQSKAQSYRVGL